MIDYIFAFADQPTAQTDPVVGAYFVGGFWRGDVCLAGLRVTVNGSGGTISVTNADGSTSTQPGPDALFDSQWRIAIALPTRVAALDASPALEIVASRDLANAGEPLAGYVLYSSVPVAGLAALRASPQFAGANYVYGG